MSDIARRIAGLSPEKRRVLELLLLDKAEDIPQKPTIPSIPRGGKSNAWPLSLAQQRLWFLDQLEPGSSLYNIPAIARLTGSLNVAALEQGVNEILRRHEALRTTFATVDRQPVQVIASDMTLALSVADLQKLSEAEREAQALRFARAEVQKPFDLACGPLLRATLLKLSGRVHVLILVIHHIVSDGWSIGVLIRELAALYEAFSMGKPSPLPKLPIQYVDFAVWQHEWLQGSVLAAQLAYWKRQLSGRLPVLALPTDRPRPVIQTYHGALHVFVLSASLLEALRALGRAEGATLFMTLLAAFQAMLHSYTGQDDIIVGTDIASRNRIETEGLIGFFVNQLVLRTDLSGHPTFRELLGRVREVALDGYAHQDLPFDKLVEALKPERDLSRNPLFQVLFVLHEMQASVRTLSLPDLVLKLMDIDSGTAAFDFSLHLVEDSEGLRGSFTYNTDLFEAATVAQMASDFATILHKIAIQPDVKLPVLDDLLAESKNQRQRLKEIELRGARLQKFNQVRRQAIAGQPGGARS